MKIALVFTSPATLPLVIQSTLYFTVLSVRVSEYTVGNIPTKWDLLSKSC